MWKGVLNRAEKVVNELIGWLGELWMMVMNAED